MRWTVSKTSGRKLVDEVSDGFSINGVVPMGDGSTPGKGTDPPVSSCFGRLGVCGS
jgi:hypothetical protein